MGDKYYAITETTSMREIDPITLETGPRVNASDFVAMHTQTGHPHTGRLEINERSYTLVFRS